MTEIQNTFKSINFFIEEELFADAHYFGVNSKSFAGKTRTVIRRFLVPAQINVEIVAGYYSLWIKQVLPCRK